MNNWETFLMIILCLFSGLAMTWCTTLSRRILRIEYILFEKDWDEPNN